MPDAWMTRVRPIFAHVDRILKAENDVDAAQRMSLFAFVVRIVSAAIAFVSQVILARWMGSFEYGIYVLVWVTVVILGNISCLGFHTAVIRFVPQYRDNARLDELRGILLASRLFVIAVSTAFAAGGALIVWLMSGSIESYYVIPFLLGALCMPMIALGDLLDGTSRANTWPVFALMPTYIVRPLLILALMIAAHAAGFESSARVALVCAIAATYVTTLIQFLSVTARLERTYPSGPRVTHLRLWMAVAFPIFLVEGFFFILTNADVLMVGSYLPPRDVAVYFATVKTLALVHFVYFAVKAGAAQRFAGAMHGADGPAAVAAFARDTVAWTFWPSLAMSAVVLLLGGFLLSLFGEGFDAGHSLLFVLVIGVMARASVGPAESLLSMSGYQKACAAVFGVTLAVNIALNMLLIPVLGLMGAAIATAIAMVVEASLLALVIWRRFGFAMFVFAPRRPLAEVG